MANTHTIDRAIIRIRAWRAAAGWSVSRLAGAAGLTESTLRFLDAETWNPTAETLRKLEAVIPPGWQAGDAVPASAEAGAPPQGEGQAA